MNNPAVIGALAGLVSALLFVSAATSAVAAALLMVYITPLPLMIAGLGWGIRQALIGLGVGMVVQRPLRSA